jgi:hypothetical protein
MHAPAQQCPAREELSHPPATHMYPPRGPKVRGKKRVTGIKDEVKATQKLVCNACVELDEVLL